MTDTTEMRTATASDLSLRNNTCIYCCCALTRTTRSREHVIARNFVPGGAPDVNLIAWACLPCNGAKAELENDISLISMLPDRGRTYPNESALRADIQRKAKNAVSRRTRKLVRDSNESLTIEGEMFPGVKVSVGMVCGPQLDAQRVFELARYHVQGFFYLATYKRERRIGALMPGVFGPVTFTHTTDWGNPLMRGFMAMTVSWDARVLLTGPDTNFRYISRRISEKDIWSWALEWNRNVRVVGFFGEDELVRTAFADLPRLKKKQFSQADGIVYRYWDEVALLPEEDTLFRSA